MDNGNDEFLDSVEGEAAFFQSVARSRPAGVHRFMNIVSVRQNINEISGRWVTIEQIWRKLRQYYIMDNVEQIVSGLKTWLIPVVYMPSLTCSIL